MDVAFSTAALTALCNSERRLAQRWGRERGRKVARRLLDLAAVDPEGLERLPGARVRTSANGRTVIRFGDEILIRGIIRTSKRGTSAGSTEATLIITNLDVEGNTRR